MEIKSLEIEGLFGRYDYQIPFRGAADEGDRPAVTILHGVNGVGKTTILRFLDAFLRKERAGAWDAFRVVPFRSCTLRVSDVPAITVRPDVENEQEVLRCEYDGMTVTVGRDLGHREPYTPEETKRARALWDRFDGDTSNLSFQFLQTARIEYLDPSEEEDTVDREVRRRVREGAARAWGQERLSLSERMQRFIANAQLDNRRFFLGGGSDLFNRIIDRLTSPSLTPRHADELLTRLRALVDSDNAASRFGLGREEWDFEKLQSIVLGLSNAQTAAEENALAVVEQYVEMLEARAVQRGLVVERLAQFEAVMDEFFVGKQVRVTADEGLHIEMDSEPRTVLRERDLSSGERHLLYLIASAVMARGRGTVIAIDEPEMSMHIAWQRRLIPALIKCAARAEPQFIFATHSPEIIADYQDALVELNPSASHVST